MSIEDLFEQTPQQAAAEIMMRRRAANNLIDFATYTKPGYIADPFHYMVADYLDMVARRKIDRLMIFAPPQHGKSELSTRRFPAFMMGKYPEQNIISASYGADFSKGFGREVRGIVESKEYAKVFPRVSVRHDNRAADEWQLDQGGKYFAVGVGTGTTGRGAHTFLIDDPIKDRKDADSLTNREDQWNWYRDVVYTRLAEQSAIVLTLTRWHHDDIAGRLLELAAQGKGKPWTILRLPALTEPLSMPDGSLILNDDGSVPGDPLGRGPYEPLAPNRFSYETLLEKQEVMGDRSWSAMYQQRPIALEGGMFRSSWIKNSTVPLPSNRTRVRAWDLAASSNGDYTVGVLMSKTPDGKFYIENVVRFRKSALDVENKIMEIAASDGRSVKIMLPQDPGQAGKGQAAHFLRKLAGWNVRAVRPSGSKEVRATAFAAQCEAGNVLFGPDMGHWQTAFLDELDTFPLGTNDDQVDAAADAFNALLGPKRAAILSW